MYVAQLPNVVVPSNTRPIGAVYVGRSCLAGVTSCCLGRQIRTTGRTLLVWDGCSGTLEDWQLVLPYIGEEGQDRGALIDSGISEFGESFLVSEGSNHAKNSLNVK